MKRTWSYFASVSALLVAVPASADIVGFSPLGNWTYNQSDAGSPGGLIGDDTIQLTSLGTGQARSIFYNVAQNINQFTASFTYRASNASIFGCEYGATFTIQREGPGALGTTGGGLGYSGIDDSAAISLQLRSNTSGFFTNGSLGGGSPSVNPISLVSGNEIEVTLTYDGLVLTQTMRDTVTGQENQRSYIIGNLSEMIGGDTAFIGFTASTTSGACSGNAANQYFSGFRFTSVPTPGTAGLLAVGLLATGRRRR